MYRQCTTEKATKQQRVFEECMLEAMLKYTYDEITITGLCHSAGLSRRIFYRLFETKMDVLYAMVDHKLIDFQNFKPDLSIKPGGLHHFFSFWKEQEKLLDALSKYSCTSLLTDRTAMFILQEDQNLAHCLGGDLENGNVIILFTLSAIYSLVLHWHSTGYQKSIDEMSQLLMELLTTPLVKSSPDTDRYIP